MNLKQFEQRWLRGSSEKLHFSSVKYTFKKLANERRVIYTFLEEVTAWHMNHTNYAKDDLYYCHYHR